MSQPEPLTLDPRTERLLESIEVVPIETERARSAGSQRRAGLRLRDHGQYGEAELCLRVAYLAARQAGEVEQAAQIGLDLARSVVYRSPREALGIVRQVLHGRPTSLDVICLHNLIGSVLMELCESDLAELSFERASDGRMAGAPVYRAYAEANRARNAFERGDTGEAARLNRRVLGRLEALDDPVGVGLVLFNMAIHAMREGTFEDAVRLLERSGERQRASGHLRLAAMEELCRGELALAVGDRTTALELFDRCERIAGQASLPAVRARALIWKTLLREDPGGAALLTDLETAARDLHARGMRTDSAIVYLVASGYAEREGLPYERYHAVARSILGHDSATRQLRDLYARTVGAMRSPRRRFERELFPEFLSQSPAILRVKDRLQRLVDTDVRILLEGESGTGKTFLARQVHAAGRKPGPFIVVDCTNLEENLFESKLFGHRRGAFTGAVSDAVGLVEQAHTGTLFLDEIGELPLEIQAKLLYTIEEQRYRPVGARHEKTADFRVLAATNRDIDAMLGLGALRQDLFFRLSGFRITLPPLRERLEDLPLLIEHCLETLNRRYRRRKVLSVEVWDAVGAYAWPGNVRELNGTLERGFHLAPGRQIGLEDLGLGLSVTSLESDDLSWYGVRRAHLLRVLRLCRGNVTQAARLLGLNRTTLIYKLKLLDIARADFDPDHALREEAPVSRLVAEAGETPVVAPADRDSARS
ncbi:MAG TPA: sigma 54-interacting transcriptional regulator [Gemmatimonadota bacterium]|nr:sigma 54-interacting transcriptional regulator [Gemmatimonadota bacterium]